MASSVVTAEDEESVRKKYENATLNNANELGKNKPSENAQLPSIKLGMSFSDWKQRKGDEEGSHQSNRGIIRPRAVPSRRQNQRAQTTFDTPHHQQRQQQQQNQFNNDNHHIFKQHMFPDLNKPNQNQQYKHQRGRNFFQGPIVPTKNRPLLQQQAPFDDFCKDETEWSSGQLMQPLFPPMPQMPPYVRRPNTSDLGVPKRPLTRFRPKSGGQSHFKANYKFRNKASESKGGQIQQSLNETVTQEHSPPGVKTQPQIYIYRPTSKNSASNRCNGKEKNHTNWIVKPTPPPPIIANTPEEREEKSRLWREYRQAMKPFKHKVFKNCKRVMQRFGKMNYAELDEKQRERLDRATQFVNEHKAMLNARTMDRSKQVELSLKEDKTSPSADSIPSATNESSLQSSKLWSASTTATPAAWSTGTTSAAATWNVAQTPPQSLFHQSTLSTTPLMDNFVPGGIWQPVTVSTTSTTMPQPTS